MDSFSFSRFAALCLKVGNLTFGGGDPTMAAFHHELVVSRRWIASERYGLIFALARITPGTNLLAFCAGVGWDLARWAGALAAVGAVGGPCAFAVVWFTFAYETWKADPAAMAAIGGTLAAAVGIMAGGAIQLVRPQWRAGRRLRTALVVTGAVALASVLGLQPIAVLGLGAATGLVWRTA